MKHFTFLKLVTVSIVLLASAVVTAQDLSIDFVLDTLPANDNDVTRRLACTVADSSAGELNPRLLLSAWDEECQLIVRLLPERANRATMISIDSPEGGRQRVNISQDVNTDIRLYQREDMNIEWEVVLASLPDTNIFEYSIQSRNLYFIFQDTALVSNDLKGNSNFPDSTIYSWIAYHASKRHNYIIAPSIGDTVRYDYGTGIAFTIYRPKAFDSRGDMVWCSLEIDTTARLLRLIVPGDFLRRATYPVTIDPTIGNSTTGSWDSSPTNWLLQVPYSTHESPTGDGAITAGYVYSKNGDITYVCSLRCYAYDYSATLADCDLIASSDSISITNTSLQWNSTSFNSESIYSSSEYMPAFKGYNSGNFALRVAYGIGSWGDNRYLSGSDWSVPSTLSGAASSSESWSCYFEYTLSGSGQLPWRRRRIIEDNK